MAHKDFGAKAWLQPMPVTILGTYDKDGNVNAMNAAWVGQWDYKQVCISLGKHATTVNMAAGSDITIALADKKNLVAADFVGIVSADDDPDKMKKAAFTVEKSQYVNAPVFTNFPITLECKISEKIGEKEVGGGCNLIADIINIRCQEEFLDKDGNPDIDKMELICFDSISSTYRLLGAVVGKAFEDGNKLK